MSWFLLSCLSMKLTLSLTDWGLTHTSVYELLCRCWLHEVEFASAWSGAYWDLPLDLPLVKLIGFCSDVFWSWSLGVFVVGSFGRDFVASLHQTLPVTSPEQHVWSYKVIHSLWLPLLSLSVWGKDQAAYQGQFSPALVLGVGQQKYQGTPRSASTCLFLSAPY